MVTDEFKCNQTKIQPPKEKESAFKNEHYMLCDTSDDENMDDLLQHNEGGDNALMTTWSKFQRQRLEGVIRKLEQEKHQLKGE